MILEFLTMSATYLLSTKQHHKIFLSVITVSVHHAQNWVWKKLKPADMRPWSLNYVVFCGPETVILKILTLAKGILQAH